MEITTDQILKWLREALDVAARSGFDDDAYVLEMFEERVRDEFRDHSDDERTKYTNQLMDELRTALKAQRQAELGWKDKTTNDHIDAAFAELEASHGIVALQNAGYTQSDGWSDVHEFRGRVDDAWGAVFFHGQDVERGVRDQGLMLAFGAFVQGDQHEPQSIRVAKTACDVLEKHGVATEWNGTLQTRPTIKPFTWQKRRYTKAP